MAGGRPSKYTPELLDKANAYLEEVYIDRGDVVPSIAGLARYLDVSRETLRLWQHEHEEFFAICKRLMAEQERLLLAGALTNEFNSTISRLMLTKHGYSEKQELEHSGKDGGPIEVRVNLVRSNQS